MIRSSLAANIAKLPRVPRQILKTFCGEKVNFSDFGVLHGTSSAPFDNLILVNFNPNSEFFALDGMSLRQFLILAEGELGGSSSPG
jgi:hypothetical protein